MWNPVIPVNPSQTRTHTCENWYSREKRDPHADLEMQNLTTTHFLPTSDALQRHDAMANSHFNDIINSDSTVPLSSSTSQIDLEAPPPQQQTRQEGRSYINILEGYGE
jgi:hypothetical protein